MVPEPEVWECLLDVTAGIGLLSSALYLADPLSPRAAATTMDGWFETTAKRVLSTSEAGRGKEGAMSAGPLQRSVVVCKSWLVDTFPPSLLLYLTAPYPVHACLLVI